MQGRQLWCAGSDFYANEPGALECKLQGARREMVDVHQVLRDRDSVRRHGGQRALLHQLTRSARNLDGDTAALLDELIYGVEHTHGLRDMFEHVCQGDGSILVAVTNERVSVA